MDAIGTQIFWRGQTTSVGSKDQLKIAKQTGCLDFQLVSKQWIMM